MTKATNTATAPLKTLADAVNALSFDRVKVSLVDDQIVIWAPVNAVVKASDASALVWAARSEILAALGAVQHGRQLLSRKVKGFTTWTTYDARYMDGKQCALRVVLSDEERMLILLGNGRALWA